MGAGCCKAAVELNPDGKPKEPQTSEQKKEDPKELRRMARAADWQQMRMLLRRMPLRQICSGASKDEGPEDEVGNTALHFAVSINHLRGVRKLLRYGTLPHMRNAAGQTPLHLALLTGKLKAARLLLERSVAMRAETKKPLQYLINVQDAKGESPFMYVLREGRLKLANEVVAMCRDLDVDIDFDLRDKQGNTACLYAAKWGWFDELEAWVERLRLPAKVLNVMNKGGETVLGHVLMFGASGLLTKQRSGALATKLTGLGALVSLPAFQERVPLLCLAASADDMGVYEHLISKGSNPAKVKDALGRTPLHYAAAKGSRLVADDLLSKGLKAYALDSQKNTPLHLAAMRGQEALVDLLLDRADDKFKALLTPNKDGLSAYHLALKAGADDRAQNSSIKLIEVLGERFTAPVIGRKNAVTDTPLLLAISGHQERTVKVLLEKGLSPNEANARGELPMARVMAAATAPTYDNDSNIFDQLIVGGANMDSAGETSHPLLAICKNNLSKFAEKAVRVLTERCGQLDWNKRDDKGYTPLALAAYHDNAFLVKYLIETVGVNPNADEQRSRSTAPEVVGTTGSLCCTKPIMVAGTVEGQTPLMCAAKGASHAAVQLLLNRGADPAAVDSMGRTALQHAMHLDKAASLRVAAALLQMGANPAHGVKEEDGSFAQCIDLIGESWPHRAVRYGCSQFLELWAQYGGSLELLATTADDADDMPGAELREDEKGDFLDFAPSRVANVPEEEDEELVDDGEGEDSEKAAEGEDNEGGGGAGGEATAPGAVAEGVEGDGSTDSDDDCGEDTELAELIASGAVESYYAGPTPRMMLRWRRRGARWWDEFWVDGEQLPDAELEGDVHWEDKYNFCDEGDEWIDEEDVEDEIWEQVRDEQRRAAAAARRGESYPYDLGCEGGSGAASPLPGSGASSGPPTPTMISRVSQGLAHKLFRRRLPNAAVPPDSCGDADGSGFAAGSPSKWLRRKSAASYTSGGAETPTYVPGSPRASRTQLLPGRGASEGAPWSPAVRTRSMSATTGPGPVAESREDDMAVEDLDNEDEDAGGDGASDKGGDVEAVTKGSWKRGKSMGHMSMAKSMRMTAGKLVAGVSGDRMWANEPYYRPESRYDGRPRYMQVETEERPESFYRKKYIEDDFLPRVAALDPQDDKPLEGPELRARNIQWYNKSMSPQEFPLKIGKWKSFLKLSKKAVEKARKRRPCKPGQKPLVRKKTAWFGLPDLPSRPELSQTSPLVYAVRLGRASCVKVLIKYSAASVNLPDAFGHTPIAYAMFLLAKEKHNKAMQQIVDMLLAARPLLDAGTVFRFLLLPRMEEEAKAMQAAFDSNPKPTRKQKKDLDQKKNLVAFFKDNYTPSEFPHIMQPVFLAVLLNDVGRLAVMVELCGANINSAWVSMPDIPTYFQGQWEKQLGRVQSRVGPLHMAICQKKYDTVRAVLDLGADPNLSGVQYVDDYGKNLRARAKVYASKKADARTMKDMARNSNPYLKLWQDKSASLVAMLMGAKRFVASIELPGLSRPHPWISPLHLSCRFGLPDITYLLIRRGGAVNGGPASAYAPKSPLEEALAYARANAQCYGTVSERINYCTIMERSFLETSPDQLAEVEAAYAVQAAKRREYEARLRAKAEKLAAESIDPNTKKGKSPEAFMLKASLMVLNGSKLAEFDPKSLEKIPLPDMNPAAIASKASKMLSNAMAMFDPVKASLKAVALAAKIILKVYLAMIKRPIAHHDPALACAHVMLWHRAPIDVSEKQTGILIRDILDNGQTLDGCNKRASYYRWLNLDPNRVNDEVWVQSVVNKIAVLKANVAYGYMQLDLTPDCKVYDKYKRKFMGAVHAAILDTGSGSIMPAYLQDTLMQSIESIKDLDPNLQLQLQEGVMSPSALRTFFRSYLDSLASKQDALVAEYSRVPDAGKETWVLQKNFGEVPHPADRDALARGLMPQWVYPEGGSEASDPADAPPQTEGEVIDYLVKRFLAYDPDKLQPAEYREPPLSAGSSIWEQMLAEEGPKAKVIDFEWPRVTEEDIAAVKPKLRDVQDADVAKAVVRALNARRAEQAAALSGRLMQRSKARADAALALVQRQMREAAERKAAAMKEVAASLAQQARAFDEGVIFEAALEGPMWEAAANKLGGDAAAAAFVSKLRGAAKQGLVAVEDPLELAKSMGPGALKLGHDAVFGKLEAKLGHLPPQLRTDLTQVLPHDPNSIYLPPVPLPVPVVDPAAAVDAVAQSLGATMDQLQDPESCLNMATQLMGEDYGSVVEVLQKLLADGQISGSDLEGLVKDLVQGATDGYGPDAMLGVVEGKVGPLPEESRQQFRAASDNFAERLKQQYEEKGIDGVVGAVTLLAVGASVAVTTGLVAAAEGAVDGYVAQAEAVAGAVQDAANGDFTALTEMAEDKLLSLPIPLPKPLAEAREALKAVAQHIELAASVEDLVAGQAEALTGGSVREAVKLATGLQEAAGEVFGKLEGEASEAADQFMAGMEINLEVDTQALMEALEEMRDVLEYLLEMVGIDDI